MAAGTTRRMGDRSRGCRSSAERMESAQQQERRFYRLRRTPPSGATIAGTPRRSSTPLPRPPRRGLRPRPGRRGLQRLTPSPGLGLRPAVRQRAAAILRQLGGVAVALLLLTCLNVGALWRARAMDQQRSSPCVTARGESAALVRTTARRIHGAGVGGLCGRIGDLRGAGERRWARYGSCHFWRRLEP